VGAWAGWVAAAGAPAGMGREAKRLLRVWAERRTRPPAATVAGCTTWTTRSLLAADGNRPQAGWAPGERRRRGCGCLAFRRRSTRFAMTRHVRRVPGDFQGANLFYKRAK